MLAAQHFTPVRHTAFSVTSDVSFFAFEAGLQRLHFRDERCHCQRIIGFVSRTTSWARFNAATFSTLSSKYWLWKVCKQTSSS